MKKGVFCLLWLPLENLSLMGTYIARRSIAGETRSVLVTSTNKTIRSEWTCVGSLGYMCMHQVRK